MKKNIDGKFNNHCNNELLSRCFRGLYNVIIETKSFQFLFGIIVWNTAQQGWNDRSECQHANEAINIFFSTPGHPPGRDALKGGKGKRDGFSFKFLSGDRAFSRDVIKFLNPKLQSHQRFYPRQV